MFLRSPQRWAPEPVPVGLKITTPGDTARRSTLSAFFRARAMLAGVGCYGLAKLPTVQEPVKNWVAHEGHVELQPFQQELPAGRELRWSRVCATILAKYN